MVNPLPQASLGASKILKRWQEEKVKELQPVRAILLWNEKYIYLCMKFIALSVNEDDENDQTFNEKMFRILK
jgi:hypothetical protein